MKPNEQYRNKYLGEIVTVKSTWGNSVQYEDAGGLKECTRTEFDKRFEKTSWKRSPWG